MDITPPKSDQGVQRLKETNRKGSVKQSDRISAYPAIESSETHHETGVKPAVERRKGQRRQLQRRQSDTETPYDTRSGVERRNAGRRHGDRLQEEHNPGSETTVPKIDEKV